MWWISPSIAFGQADLERKPLEEFAIESKAKSDDTGEPTKRLDEAGHRIGKDIVSLQTRFSIFFWLTGHVLLYLRYLFILTLVRSE